jgi:hypothetical protein
MIQTQSLSPQEFHRRRSEAEMERALAAAKPSIAMIHLELAKIHRETRNRLTAEQRAQSQCGCRPFNGTDKEA